MIAKLWKREPLAVCTLMITIAVPVLQSEIFDDLTSGDVAVTAYYKNREDGRCSLIAMSFENETDDPATDIRVNVISDHLIATKKESLEIHDRQTGLIPRGAVTPMPYRPVLDIDYSARGETVEIPVLLPGEYIDLFVGRVIDSRYDAARVALSQSEHYRNTPRLGIATYAGGKIEVNDRNSCSD